VADRGERAGNGVLVEWVEVPGVLHAVTGASQLAGAGGIGPELPSRLQVGE